VTSRKTVMRITENRSLINTIVMGWNVRLATLNQMKEKDQKIIESTTALYVLNFLFNFIILTWKGFSCGANLYFILLLTERILTNLSRGATKKVSVLRIYEILQYN
jgi:hypothetical protein